MARQIKGECETCISKALEAPCKDCGVCLCSKHMQEHLSAAHGESAATPQELALLMTAQGQQRFTDWEWTFLNGVKDLTTITPRQAEIVHEIWDAWDTWCELSEGAGDD